MQSVYSWMGTRIHLVLEDDLATAYNRAQVAFFEAQNRYQRVHGSTWTGKEPLDFYWQEGDGDAYNKIASVINLLIEVNGGTLDIQEEETTSDYLIKL